MATFYELKLLEYLRYEVTVHGEKIGEIRMDAVGGPLFHYKSETHPEERTTSEIAVAARTLLKEAIEAKEADPVCRCDSSTRILRSDNGNCAMCGKIVER